ncbi:uncharacterized protein BDZ83DRAFT_89111 [Colletotrichum acutatum]|uniref:Uncharacterized protein n=1 Tax=Glomerella acutata TaxID=27357 RepID=A0AAD8XKC1_GLOAC|nr:uncharacterized protein BDZ83DRAFT_89111 [Colletotrichum acutatum]KAK1728961.1 hypothetical protein BDZ83DRAFT_89111 [Colletotrichum acutatum]
MIHWGLPILASTSTPATVCSPIKQATADHWLLWKASDPNGSAPPPSRGHRGWPCRPSDSKWLLSRQKKLKGGSFRIGAERTCEQPSAIISVSLCLSPSLSICH